MRGIALLVCLAVLLAGCSGGGGDGGSAATAGSATLTSSGPPPPPPVPRTDTLHFLAAPEMTPAAPVGTDIRNPVNTGFSGFGGGGGGQDELGAEWSYKVTENANVTGGEVHVWIEIKEQLIDFPNSPIDDSCTWELTTAIGADTEEIDSCLNEPAGPIAPGIKELVFTLVLQDPIELEPGETLTVVLERTAFNLSPSNSVDALSGSAEHDSRIQLRGLKEPVE